MKTSTPSVKASFEKAAQSTKTGTKAPLIRPVFDSTKQNYVGAHGIGCRN